MSIEDDYKRLLDLKKQLRQNPMRADVLVSENHAFLSRLVAEQLGKGVPVPRDVQIIIDKFNLG